MNQLLDIYKRFSLSDIVGEKSKDVTIVGDHVMLQDLKSEIQSKIKTTQKETAKKIIKRFYRKTETSEAGVQTESIEDKVEEMKMQIQQKESTITYLRIENAN